MPCLEDRVRQSRPLLSPFSTKDRRRCFVFYLSGSPSAPAGWCSRTGPHGGPPPVGCADAARLAAAVRNERGRDNLVPVDDGGGEHRCSFSSSTSKEAHRYSSGTPVPKSRPPIRCCPAHPHARGFASSCTRHLKRGRGELPLSLPPNLDGTSICYIHTYG